LEPPLPEKQKKRLRIFIPGRTVIVTKMPPYRELFFDNSTVTDGSFMVCRAEVAAIL
tara:strand:+ start:757 stop:927 length:171 start_codon:yes stop_codon:yes gene_type:complete